MTSNRIPAHRAILLLTVSCGGLMACGSDQPLGNGAPATPLPGGAAAETSKVPASPDVARAASPPPSAPMEAVTTDPTNRCPCSRAPGRLLPPAGWTCPAATGATTAASIGPEGGSVSLVTGTEGVPWTYIFHRALSVN